MKKIVSSCIYCGCGCKLTYHVENNKILKVTGVRSDPMSLGKPCVKGLTINEVFDKNRIISPYIRKNKKLVKVSWEEAIDFIYKKIKNLNARDIFLNGSGKITNEDNFLIYKLANLVFNTNNIDSCCGRLCHISTLKGMADCFGATNLTDLSKLEELDTLLILGSNPATNYPVFWNKILKQKKKLKIISAQPLINLTSKFGDLFIEIELNTEIVLLNGIINYLINKNSFVGEAKSYKDFEKLKKVVEKYTPSYVCKICGINENEFLDLCRIIEKSKKFGVSHGMGLTQHINSLGNIHSLLNLVLLKKAYLLVLRGEINVQGAGDVFSSNVDILSDLWKNKIKKQNGNLVKSLLLNPVKAAFITEFNPAQSLPNLNKVHKILDKMFIVYFGAYFNLTCDFADVILPIPALFETSGTITNGEQRIRLVRPAVDYDDLNFLEITKLFAKKFGKQDLFQYENSKQVFEELIQANPVYSKLDSNKIYSGEDAFIKGVVKHRKFFPEKFKGADERRTKDFPFLLTTFRETHHFLTSEITDNSKTLNDLDKDRLHVFMNPEDAKEIGIVDEDKLKISSKVGEIYALARVSKEFPEKLIATRFHYKEMLVNKLFDSEFDKVTFTPNYKCCAVKVEKVE